MRICSLLPGATEVVAALGLTDELVAISHECDYPPAIRSKPVVIHSAVNSGQTHSFDIDRQVRATLKTGASLYCIDEDLLRRTNPDLIITQDLCDVCAITPREIQRAIAGMECAPRILSMNPTCLDDIFRDIIEIGIATNREPQARLWVAELQDRVKAVRTVLADVASRHVACIEWLDPLYNAGHWIPEMVALAGGKDCLARAGTKSAIVSWEEVLSQGPEVLILMPCGFSMVQTRSELHRLTCRPGWAGLPAVRTGDVYVVDGPAYFNRPGPRLVDGLELLAALFHPQRFGQGVPAGAARI